MCFWLRRVNKPYTFTLKPQEVQQRIFSCLPTIIPPLKKKIKRKIIKSCCFPQQICITKSKENDEETVNEIRWGTGEGAPPYEIPWLNCAALQIKFYPGNEQQVVLKDDSLAGSSETRDIMGKHKHYKFNPNLFLHLLSCNGANLSARPSNTEISSTYVLTGYTLYLTITCTIKSPLY